MTISQLKQKYLPLINQISASPELDIQVIVCHILQINTTEYILQSDISLSQSDQQKIDDSLNQRSQNYPVAYILGYKEFYGRNFIVSPDTLIPRPESENIIEIIRKLNPTKTDSILDIGTGSGCLAITLAKEFPFGTTYASDVSVSALHIARKNAILHSVEVQLIQSDLLDDISVDPTIIVANLPYVDNTLSVDPSIEFEPSLAIFSEDNGLDHYYRLLHQIQIKTHPPQWIIIEIDPRQLSLIDHWIRQSKLEIRQIYQDLQGHNRHILITKKN